MQCSVRNATVVSSWKTSETLGSNYRYDQRDAAIGSVCRSEENSLC